jgi:phosphoribosyl 1,2-cyclic phosphodiesterase
VTLRFGILGSGSKGNCVVVQAGATTVLIDAGLPPKETRRRLRALGLTLKDIDALVLTHAHGDHIASAPSLAGALGLVTYCTEGTRDVCAERFALSNPAIIDVGVPFSIGDLRLCAFRTPHDIRGSVGFVIDDEIHRLGYCTDLGRADKLVGRALRDCDTLMLEFNYDPEMLEHGPYPPVLKRRVAGPLGHLSNDDAATLLGYARTSLLRKVLLAHISETNNLIRLAREAALTIVDGADVEVAAAPQHHPTGWLRVGPERQRPPHRTPLNVITPSQHPARSASLRGEPRPGRRRPAAVAQPVVAVSRQLTLFGGAE